jgi:hypothetical protein
VVILGQFLSLHMLLVPLVHNLNCGDAMHPNTHVNKPLDLDWDQKGEGCVDEQQPLRVKTAVRSRFGQH